MFSHRFRVSTGTVIRSQDKRRGLGSAPQCDLIVWDPSEMPAVFESGDFALVPLCSARAIIEVKRNGDKREDLIRQLEERGKLLPACGHPVLGVVITHSEPLFNRECTPNWLAESAASGPPPITGLLDDKNEPDTKGIMAFIYFLAQVAGHTRTVAT